MSSTTPGGIEIGDVFNETDDDYETCKRIVSFNDKRDPPTVICCSIKVEDESEDTEEEYDLTYVDKCVQARKGFMQNGYHEYDVKDIYKMQKHELIEALVLAKQSTTGLKQDLRDRLMFYLNIAQIPSDVSGESGDDVPPAKKKK